MDINRSGRIHTIIGCMFSGKSTEIIKSINRYKVLGKKIIIINHKSDTRYKENSIVTHDKISIDSISINNLHNIKTDPKYDYKNSEVIVIEEAQFFDDLYDFATNAADNDKKIVIVAGLDGDSKRNQFGDILKLIPHSESVTKLHALCIKCKNGTLACFSKRLINNDKQILIGVDEYIPVCRFHYLEQI